ncbi:MAG: peptidylprolyl isomerase [Bacteroidetes bacterium]|nr:peptidylprolyl isomerase [Bacteroidota bacterium]
MQISQHTVVAIDYTLTDDQGTVLDTSEGREPLYFLQGVGQIISGLEEALEGKTAGQQFSVAIPPEKGYGLRNDSLIQQVPRDRFPADADIEKGMQFRASSPEGPMMVTVTDVSLDFVMVDGNHPLAGQTLNFAVDIVEVREATASELDHGHVHGPGDDHHH